MRKPKYEPITIDEARQIRNGRGERAIGTIHWRPGYRVVGDAEYALIEKRDER